MLDDVLARIDADLDASLGRLLALLRFESISTDPAYAQSCRATAKWLAAELSEIGFSAAVRETPGHPVVVAHDPQADGLHVLFYAHYDVQPVDPIELWDTPPFEPRIIAAADGSKRIVARGAADDKGQMMTFIEACRALKAVNGRLPVKVTLVLEGEEESGSTHLAQFLKDNAAELNADVALVCDTDMWRRDWPGMTAMLRGLVAEEVIVTAANRDLHSGMFGGPARNPIHVLAGVLAALHDQGGRVTLPGFYDGVGELPDDVKAQWKTLGFDGGKFLDEIGLSIPAGEQGRSILEKIWARPTCEVNGIVGGYTGEGFKTVIPSTARAKVSFRLVGEQDPVAIAASFRKFVRERIPDDCRAEFVSYAGNPASVLPIDSDEFRKARRALKDEWGRDPAILGGGGSIPVVGEFRRILGLDSLMVGFGLPDDRIHSPNEKYELSSFHRGARSWARILVALAEWKTPQ